MEKENKIVKTWQKVESRWYSLLEKINEKGIPVSDYNNFWEQKGISSLMVTLVFVGILAMGLGIMVWNPFTEVIPTGEEDETFVIELEPDMLTEWENGTIEVFDMGSAELLAEEQPITALAAISLKKSKITTGDVRLVLKKPGHEKIETVINLASLSKAVKIGKPQNTTSKKESSKIKITLPKPVKVETSKVIFPKLSNAIVNKNVQAFIQKAGKEKYPLHFIKKSGEWTRFNSQEREFVLSMLGLLNSNELVFLREDLSKCNNGMWNADIGETDVDCGGLCGNCLGGKVCIRDSDCESNSCKHSAKPYSRLRNPELRQGRCSGEQARPECLDTDPNQDKEVFGTVNLGEQNNDDVCVSPTRVKQFSCKGDPFKEPYTIASTEIDCLQGFTCQEGACVNPNINCIEHFEERSDNALYTLDSVTDQTGQRFWDNCQDDLIVEQVYCGRTGNVERVSMQCPAGTTCANGLCIQRELCTLPNPENASYWEFNNQRHVDTCIPFLSNGITHVLCNNGSLNATHTLCEQGRTCYNGLCVQAWQTPEGVRCRNGECTGGTGSDGGGGSDDPPEHCFETDEENDPTVLGMTTDVHGNTEGDSCNSNRITNETYCIDGEIGYESKACPSGLICDWGYCERIQCREVSDTEDNPAIRGEVIVTRNGTEQSHLDICRRPEEGSTSEITEQVKCTSEANGNSRMTRIETSCASGSYCVAGACQPMDHVPTCTDSDGGQNLFVQGTAQNERNYFATDHCGGINQVVEYTCSDRGWPKNETITCPQERPFCVYGACTTCYDSDPENFPGTVGWVRTPQGLEHSDYCMNNETLAEMSCNGTEIAELRVTCSTGYHCNNGACVQN